MKCIAADAFLVTITFHYPTSLFHVSLGSVVHSNSLSLSLSLSLFYTHTHSHTYTAGILVISPELRLRSGYCPLVTLAVPSSSV